MFGFYFLVRITVICVIWSLTTVIHGEHVEGKDNKGRNFVFGFMDNLNTQQATVLEVFITTDQNNKVTVNITTPLLNPSYFKRLTIDNRKVAKISFDVSTRGIGTELSNKGIYVQSDYEIAIYAVNKSPGSTDAFVVFPVDALGNIYYIITWDQKAQFMIIATEDNTVVTITPGRGSTSITFNNHVYKSGMSLIITLNKFQTFHVFGGEISDYSGTHIKSSKDIAVLSGNLCSKVGYGYCDHLASQMTPVDTYGNIFVTINMPNCNRTAYFKLIASENNTQVNISGRSPFNLTNHGDVHTFSTSSFTQTVVSTDKPTVLAFFAEGECSSRIGDPAMILLPPIQQFAADYTFATVDFLSIPFTNSLTIVISEQDISGLLLDGHNISSAHWRPVVGSKKLRITNIEIEDGSHTIYHINPTVIFLAVSTGVAEVNSYGYVAGQRLAPINSNCNISKPVPGDIIDNDCDGLIDEELEDGIDDDGDGKIDEDLAKRFEEFSSTPKLTTTLSTTSRSTSKPSSTTLSTMSFPTTTIPSTSTTPTITSIPPTTTTRTTASKPSTTLTTTPRPSTTILTTTPRPSTTIPTTTPRPSTTTLTNTSIIQASDISDSVFSTDLLIVGVVCLLFVLSCVFTCMFFLKWKLRKCNRKDMYAVHH